MDIATLFDGVEVVISCQAGVLVDVLYYLVDRNINAPGVDPQDSRVVVLMGPLTVKRTPGLWKHKTRITPFTLVVDNFGVQCFSKEEADHLFTSVEANYPVKTDWTGSK
ncbi:hypothetical protein FRACYDRAFT_238559 [Fragilariopsis cylindrus CCMP1102]|uniref:Uncharacterized protein n=1 Tax=Fragilariopsis cylindrus CCMP1102 TaxID=635003 RepID=A0A1E7FJB6_9STRA|nr:hypothetical protein FRACYDRAFT_238559 [Fragilariopsis cylindrus CCMP1102]|eukprot:OEU18125.1 hypothetical protein FRACYDRAFT_238559 [Fragilariopsis cylindrus CCMP1102]